MKVFPGQEAMVHELISVLFEQLCQPVPEATYKGVMHADILIFLRSIAHSPIVVR